MCINLEFTSYPLEMWVPGQNARSENPSLFSFPSDGFLPGESFIFTSCVGLPHFGGHTIRVAGVFIYTFNKSVSESTSITFTFMPTLQTAGLSAFAAWGGEVTAHPGGDGNHHALASSPAGPLIPLEAPLHILSQRSLQASVRERLGAPSCQLQFQGLSQGRLFTTVPSLYYASRFCSVLSVMHNLSPRRSNKDRPPMKTGIVIFRCPLLKIHPDCSNPELSFASSK